MERPSPAVQDYLKAVYRLSEDVDGPVTSSQVAESLGVTAPSASNMLRKLEQMGYIEGGGRQGVTLTEAGRAGALEVVRLHRLIETFLASTLGMSWDEVHREAVVLVHHVSGALAERIAEALGHPEREPRGDPSPTLAGGLPADGLSVRWVLREGTAAVVRRCAHRDPELLRFLAGVGLGPAAAVAGAARGPFGGPLTVTVSGGPAVEVPPDAARAVHVEL